MMNAPSELLTKALLDAHAPEDNSGKSLIEPSFSQKKFFANWFRAHDNAYYFLFKKNLKVTDLQFAELLSLLRVHVTTKDHTRHNFRFVSVSEFNSIMNEIVVLFSEDESDILKKCMTISNLFSELLNEVIVIDSFYGSCAVFVPPTLNVDLAAICSYAGYVHSCGKVIMIRSVDKTDNDHVLEKNLQTYMSKFSAEKKIFFSVYAHESFSKFDREEIEELTDGLDDIKIYDEKFYIGKSRLVVFLKHLKKIYGSRLIIPDPGNYKEVHKTSRENNDVDRTRTIWLVTDGSIDEANKNRGNKKYYICYEQKFKNDNCFQLFDENKPGWDSHTTIPHTLAAALINITRPYWKKSSVSLLDPFMGSGTILLEALKFSNVMVHGSDLDKLSPLMMKDNLEFFSSPFPAIREIQSKLNKLIDNLQLSKNFPGYEKEIITNLMKETNNCKDSQYAINTLMSCKLYERILFYLMLRTELRHTAAFIKASEEWNTAFLQEAYKLNNQIKYLIQSLDSKKEQSQFKVSCIRFFEGNYSIACTIDPIRLNQVLISKLFEKDIKLEDATKIEGKYDLIITDPPYGVNTDESPVGLANLYQSALKSMINALKEHGQLVICLPDYTLTGRQSYYFTNRRFVTGQILSIAESLGKEVFVPAQKVPLPVNVYIPPYYWESRKALRRTILHFHFISKKTV